MQNIDREIDARGLNCPLPILRTKKALNDMKSGQVVRIVATMDLPLRVPGVGTDVPVTGTAASVVVVSD